MPTFVDTNVLVYAHDASESQKHPVARAIVEGLWASRSGTLSTQVLQEFYVVATRKLPEPMARSEAREIVALYSSWQLVRVDVEMILDATRLDESAGLAFWDALIIEAARRAGATRILSEDLQAGRAFDDIVVENPFEIP